MKRIIVCICGLLIILLMAGCSTSTPEFTTGEKLQSWLTGVWITGHGTYTIYTDSHYFVLSHEGDSANANLYFGASQIAFFDQGMTRYQTIRLRKFPGGDMTSFCQTAFTEDHNEIPPEVDLSHFDSTSCVIADGVIYDVIVETTEKYILLATCNGDHMKVYNDGRFAYLPAGGGEFWSYQVEKFGP